jgi:hypothetical protein
MRNFLGQFLEDSLDAHGSAVVQCSADSAPDHVEVGAAHALRGFAVAEYGELADPDLQCIWLAR